MQDMMYCFNPLALERQRAHLQETNNNTTNNTNFSIDNFFSLQSDDQGLGDGWPGPNSTPQYAINMREVELVTPTPSPTITTNTTISNSKTSSNSKKRKADKPPMVANDDDEKRMKGDEGEKQQGNDSSKENISDKKPDYIHVRARRGQATDSHSLAERVRRERISERMKYLQGLVPGCNKVTGKAGMLDEIINYVQSLQRQVEFLSMKLASVNPRLDFNMEALFFSKEVNLPCNSTISTVRMLPEIEDPSFLQFTTLQQPEPLLDLCFNVQRTNAGWGNELNNFYGPAFPFHSLQGNLLPNNLKTEM